jgi:hypothetical protein
MVAVDDQPFADDASRLYSETTEREKQLVVLPGGEHGTALLRGARGKAARVALLAFIEAHTG